MYFHYTWCAYKIQNKNIFLHIKYTTKLMKISFNWIFCTQKCIFILNFVCLLYYNKNTFMLYILYAHCDAQNCERAHDTMKRRGNMRVHLQFLMEIYLCFNFYPRPKKFVLCFVFLFGTNFFFNLVLKRTNYFLFLFLHLTRPSIPSMSTFSFLFMV